MRRSIIWQSKNRPGDRKPLWKKAGAVLFWIALWKLVSLAVDNPIVLAAPESAAAAFLRLLAQADFWKTVTASGLRILGGLLASGAAGIALGGASYRFPLAEILLAPFMKLLRAVPVASFVILALVWVGTEGLTFAVVAVAVLPILYTSTLNGLRAVPTQMLEVAQVFRIGSWRRIWYIYRPSLLPFLLNAASIAVGMSWKAGVAAEVIGIPDWSIGERLYMAKIYLEMDQLFAWTAAVLLLSVVYEAAFLSLLGLLGRRVSGSAAAKTDGRRGSGNGPAADEREKEAGYGRGNCGG